MHRHNPPPALINWAIRELPEMIAVPGQHDLPNHRLEDVRNSAFWTLAEAKAIVPAIEVGWAGTGIEVTPFPWETEIRPHPRGKVEGLIRVALCHRYVCRSLAEAYPGAPPSVRASALREQLRGYDVAVFGDNHKPFEKRVGDCLVYNCGALIPRTAAEQSHRPSVGLLLEDGSVRREYLDTSEDKWEDRPGEEIAGEGLTTGLAEFRRELAELSVEEVDYAGAVRRFAARPETAEAVRDILLRSVE